MEVLAQNLDRGPPLPGGEPTVDGSAAPPHSTEPLRDVRREDQLELIERDRGRPRVAAEEPQHAPGALRQHDVFLRDAEPEAPDSVVAKIRGGVVGARSPQVKADAGDPATRPHSG